MKGIGVRAQPLWVLAVLFQLVFSAPQGGSQFPDNYSVYVRALQNQNQPAPNSYSAPIPPQNQGYSPPLQAQPYRPPLIPHVQPNFNHQGNNFNHHHQAGLLQPSQPPPQQPQVRNFPQYQPPLANPFKPSQPLPQPQHNNNQQVIYVGGQQQHYNAPRQQASLPTSGSSSPHKASSGGGNNGQPVSFSTSFTSDAARQGKVVSGQAQAQAIQKAPASEIQFDKGAVAKDKDASNKKKDDEYVIYYYYYYDDENKKNNKNLTLNFDDIPNLEQYDSPNNKSQGRSNVVAGGVPNSLQSRPASTAASHQSGSVHNAVPGHNDYLTTSAPRSATAVSVSVSVSEGPQQSPVPNSYRYGNSEIPRVPIIKHGSQDLHKPPTAGVTNGVPVENVANTVVSVETKAPLTEVSSTTPSAVLEDVSEPSLEKPTEEANDVGDTKKIEVKKAETPEPETTTATEASTTEEPTTTTESSRRPGFGNRRRFGGNNNRISPTRRPSTSSTTTEAASSTRRSPRPRGRRPSSESSRIRPTRPRGRTTPAPKEEEEETDEEKPVATTEEPEISSTAASRRFGANNNNNRRFTSSRTNGRASSTTTAPFERPNRPITSRPRPAGVSPRGSGLFGRTRPPTGGARVPGRRPPYLRNKPAEEKVEEEEDKEVAVSPSTDAEEASKAATESSSQQSSTQATPASAAPAREEEEPEQPDQEDGEPTEAPAPSSTESNRRNPLFRSRTRPPLFNNRGRANPLSRNRPTEASK